MLQENGVPWSCGSHPPELQPTASLPRNPARRQLEADNPALCAGRSDERERDLEILRKAAQ